MAIAVPPTAPSVEELERIPVLPEELDDIGKIIDYAADLIERHGWTQHTGMDANRRICAGRALQMAAPDVRDGHNPVWVRFREHGIEEIVTWNDHSEQTKENVIATMRRIARS